MVNEPRAGLGTGTRLIHVSSDFGLCKNMNMSRDELLEEVGVSPTQLDKACTSEHLQDIALFLESWRTVAPHLALSNVEAEEVENDGRAENEKRRKILKVWKARFAFKAKYMVLRIKALLKIGRADQAEQVCRVLVPQWPKEGTFNKNDTGWMLYL